MLVTGRTNDRLSRLIEPLGQGYRASAAAAGAAVVVYFLGAGLELLAIRVLQPTEIELTWISEAVLAAALGMAIFLWLHLKWTRLALSRLEREHIVINTQLALAADIQRAVLPRVPSGSQDIRWAARLEQAGRIGGDLYDFVPVGSRSWLVLVGDVSGKGIPAALVLASVRTMFRMLAEETREPGELTERLAHALYEDNAGMPYLTCVIARIDVEAHRLTYVNAGHPAGLVFEGGHRSRVGWRIESTGPPAGVLPDQRYHAVSGPLPRGAVSVLVTDGITEALDELHVAGADAIASIVADLPNSPTPDLICEALIARTAPALASDGSGWQDDRTVVAFELTA